MGDSQTSNIEHVTQDTAGVLNNYKLLPKQSYIVQPFNSVHFAGGGSGGVMTVNDHAELSFVEQSGGSDTPFSISIWANITNTAASTRLFAKGDWTSGTSREYVVFVEANEVGIILIEETDTGGNYSPRRQALASFPSTFSGKWKNIILSSKGTGNNADDLLISIDGDLVESTNTDYVLAGSDTYSNMVNGAGKIYIGDKDDECYMADISLWNVDLNSTTAARTEVYNSGCPLDFGGATLSAISTNNILGWWRMGNGPIDTIDGTGVLLDDSSNYINVIYDHGNGGTNTTHVALPDSNFTSTSIANLYAPCRVNETVPFSLGVPGVPFLRNRNSPYKTNLD